MARVGLTGNDAAATALRQVNPDVVAAYPITPQTELMHLFAQFVADGAVDTELVTVESEHSAMSACIGSAAAGARTVTATSSQGLALMWEMLYIAASYRLPLVMPVVNRALSAPINIHCDHSDSMGARDSGWIQLFSEDSQEAYDNTVQAFRIAEHQDVRTPVMVTLDGFIISHTMEVVELLEDEAVKGFVGQFAPVRPLLDVDNPYTIGPLHLPDHYFETRRQQVEAMGNVPDVVVQVGQEFGALSGREYGLFEAYRLDDADLAIVALGSTCGTTKAAVDGLREKGVKAGLLKLRCYRPFPATEIVAALQHTKAVAVLDRSLSFGLEGGPLFNEVRSAAFGTDLKMISIVYGLGGRDIVANDIVGVYEKLDKIKETGEISEVASFVGLRE